MASELFPIRYTTGRTLYFHLLRSGGQIWNGSAWAAPTAAGWATYALAVAEIDAAGGLGYYAGTIPAVVAGVYTAIVFEQSGGSPATTDLEVHSTGFEWNGTGEFSNAAEGATFDPAGVWTLANGVETGLTPAHALQAIMAGVMGLLSGADTSAIQFWSFDQTKVRVEQTNDEAGNRLSLTFHFD